VLIRRFGPNRNHPTAGSRIKQCFAQTSQYLRGATPNNPICNGQRSYNAGCEVLEFCFWINFTHATTLSALLVESDIGDTTRFGLIETMTAGMAAIWRGGMPQRAMWRSSIGPHYRSEEPAEKHSACSEP
jgi:hypothetical protein